MDDSLALTRPGHTLAAARERARRERSSIGDIISTLARQALNAATTAHAVREPKAVYGLRPIASRGGGVTNEAIDRLRDDDAY